MGGTMVKLFIFVMLSASIVCFQNCANQDFSLRNDLSKATSASLDGSEQLIVDEVTSNSETSMGSSNGRSVSSQNPREIEDDVNKHTEDNKDDKGDKGDKICMRNGIKMNKTDIGVCILEGQGKSQHVALINDQIMSNNSTPKAVCMSALACRKIINEKFEVASLEKRGFCKNGSADSILLTDSQVRALIDQIH